MGRGGLLWSPHLSSSITEEAKEDKWKMTVPTLGISIAEMIDLFLWGILTSSVPFIPKGTSYPEMTGFSQSLQHSNPPARCEISPCPGREGTRCVAPPTRLPGQLRPALEASPPCQGFEGWINTSRPVGLWELLLFSSTYYKVYYF